MNEEVLSEKSDGNVAVVVTNSRVLGFSALTDKWDAVRLMMNEELVDVQVKGNVATVETMRKVLGFSARSGTWVETDFGLGEAPRPRKRDD